MAIVYFQIYENGCLFYKTNIIYICTRLVLAVGTFIRSDWFSMGCSVYKIFSDILITPLCQILGIDKHGKIQRDDRNWKGMKVFFSTKLLQLKELSNKNPTTQFDKLLHKCLIKVIENIERQLSRMPFFGDGVDTDIEDKMRHVPLSNSGCESNFGKLDARTKDASGTVPISNISDKFIIATNNYLQNDKFINNKEEEYHWARTSDEAKKARTLQEEFIASFISQKTNTIS